MYLLAQVTMEMKQLNQGGPEIFWWHVLQVHTVDLTIWLRLSVADVHTAGKHEFTKQCHVSEMIIKYICIWFGYKRYIQNNIPVDHPRASNEVKQKPRLTQQICGKVEFRLWRTDASGMWVVRTSQRYARGWHGRDGDRETDTEIYVCTIWDNSFP